MSARKRTPRTEPATTPRKRRATPVRDQETEASETPNGDGPFPQFPPAASNPVTLDRTRDPR